jgi:hypothetical protein
MNDMMISSWLMRDGHGFVKLMKKHEMVQAEREYTMLLVRCYGDQTS